ncbi:hypothetical protein C8A05DRAFT_42748 [Staphylotrichum tortipilum]|uniref:Uncharacterized protein n=1 Tax=Staphylotrichum tortipilum TaxID=2831512 RepID=A0AAN6RV41_9PEZI|nr:hypothetical protein C8A05DRAFT_42748 [Staphylotrichum longicolle]
METLRAMLACIFGRRRGADDGYTELVYDDKMALFSDTDPYYSANHQQPYRDSEPYAQHDAMSYFPSHAYGGYDDTTTTTAATFADNNLTPGRERERTAGEIGRDVARLLWEAEWNDEALQGRISEAAAGRSWNRKIVEACLDGVIEYVERGRDDGMGAVMCEALDRATEVADEAFEFPRRHPESLDGFIAIVSAGLLADLQGAWMLELLGFGEVGGKEELDGTHEIAMLTSDKIVFSDRPRPLSFAAWWVREYHPYIPEGSVYTYLQRMDMVELAD